MLRAATRSLLVVIAVHLWPCHAVAGRAGSTLVVHVYAGSDPVAQAEVRAGRVVATTNAQGDATLEVAPGTIEVIVSRVGFETATRTIDVAPPTTQVTIELREKPVVTEDVVVTATRSVRRVQDLPLRVEVVPQEEIDEKLSMTPGDIAMMLN